MVDLPSSGRSSSVIIHLQENLAIMHSCHGLPQVQISTWRWDSFLANDTFKTSVICIKRVIMSQMILGTTLPSYVSFQFLLRLVGIDPAA